MGFAKTLWIILRRLLMTLVFAVVFITSAVMTYYFSRGEEVAVPDVVGKNEDQARKSAAQIGMKVEVIDVFDSQEQPGKVLRQYPKPGAIIRKGGSTTLRINVSRVKQTSRNTDSFPLAPPTQPSFDLTPWSEDLCGVLIAFRLPSDHSQPERLRKSDSPSHLVCQL